MDDILIFWNNIDKINEIKDILKNNFEIKDMGKTNEILGVNLNGTNKGMQANQSFYIENILKKFGY